MVASSQPTISELIRTRYSDLTRKERKFADILLANYPVAGLASITEVADNAGVSTPTILRTAKKLGFKGFPGFQSALRRELKETLANPIAKHERWASEAPEGHILNQFADATMENLSSSLRQIDHRTFDKVSKLLADEDRKIAVVGGRLSHALADYLATHLQVVRNDVTLLSTSPSRWPHHLLNMSKGDVLVLFDVRRYEANLSDLARLAEKRGIRIVLFTDQWMSPVSGRAAHTLAVRIEVPSGWDSAVVTMFMVEALVAAVETHRWPQTRARIKDLEKLFDDTRRFLKKPE
ncbi:MAG TPA: MurR/RpiR family transcriptional regulator [Rhizobiales bacterium]|nr:MurR/RpiR family transcriptional regulator [Hyphomicrobiales bacterium]